MFGDGSQMPDMSALLAQAQQMQEQLVAAKAELDAARVDGSTAGGLVTATVTGGGDVVAVDIKPEAVDPADTETLGDMVVAAIRDARDKADAMAAERLGPFAGGAEGMFGGGDGPALPGGEGEGEQRPPLGFS